MNVAFLTEIGFRGKVPSNHPNCRTEMAWMVALDAIHYNIWDYSEVKEYDVVFIIVPKGDLNLNIVGVELIKKENPISSLLSSNFIEILKSNNKKVCFIQEGPVNLTNDYSLPDQFNYYNQLQECDILFAHNHENLKWYKGLFPNKPVHVIPTLMIEDAIKSIQGIPQNKVMISGNFCIWYGGFQSYIIATDLDAEIWVPTSHASREGENQIPDLKVLPRVSWIDWIKVLSTYKYGINMMPTTAAGTFSLNCAYFGIPCIGNKKLDTQSVCYPDLSVDVEDVEYARKLAVKLKTDESFYNYCRDKAIYEYLTHFTKEKFLKKMYTILK